MKNKNNVTKTEYKRLPVYLKTKIAEVGNIEYCMFFPMDSDDDICILEKWESKENIEAHQKTLHYAILNELKEKYVEKVEIKKYWVEELM